MQTIYYTGIFFLLLFGAQQATAGNVSYQISPVFTGYDMHLNVRASFPGNASGQTLLNIPADWEHANQLYRCLRKMRLESPGCTLEMSEDSSFAWLIHKPRQPITLVYEVHQDVWGANMNAHTCIRPNLQGRYFQVMGTALFVTPEFNDGYEVSLEWKGFPEKWLLHNSFGHQQRIQHISRPDRRWMEAVFIGGEYRILQTSVFGHPVYLAVRGTEWSFSDEKMLETLRQAVETQRLFWNDSIYPYFTVVMSPLAPAPVMQGGPVTDYHTGMCGFSLEQSFAAFTTPAISLQELSLLFHHEMMHAWVGRRMQVSHTPEEKELLWFSEGFTEYFAYKNMLKNNVLGPDEYVETLNRDYFEYLYQSGIWQIPNNVIVAHYNNRFEMRQQPVKRGFLLAFYFDQLIKANGNGKHDLQDFMLDLYQHMNTEKTVLQDDFPVFTQLLSHYLGQDAAPLIQTYIEDGYLIPANRFILPDYWSMGADADGIPVLRLNKKTTGWETAMMR